MATDSGHGDGGPVAQMQPQGCLSGKVALITGSGRGIGRGIALRFAEAGAVVVINDMSLERTEAATSDVATIGGRYLTVAADVSQKAEVDALIDQVVRSFGRIDMLVNNAQMFVHQGESGPFLEMTHSGWDYYVRANLNMLFNCTQQVARVMVDTKISGSIVNISSGGAQRVHRNLIAYDTVKGAMDTFTRAVAVDLGPLGIRCNGLRPAMIATNIPPGESSTPRDGSRAVSVSELSETERARQVSAVPLGRVGVPADVAAAAVFLASDDAGFITGQVFDVDGGLLLAGRPAHADLTQVAPRRNQSTELVQPVGSQGT